MIERKEKEKEEAKILNINVAKSNEC